MNMLEYSKTIIKKVSFDLTLFEKELVKSLTCLKKDQRLVLLDWSAKEFTAEKKEIVKRYLRGEALRNDYECDYLNVG